MNESMNSEPLDQELLQDKTNRSDNTRATLTQHDPNQNNERPKAKKMGATFKRLFRYTLRYKKWLILANIGMLVSSAGMVFLPLLCGNIIDHIKDG